MSEPVWTGHDLYLRIYASNNLGEKLQEAAGPQWEAVAPPWEVGDPALLDFCFCNSVTVQGSGQSQLRDRECQDKRELVVFGAWDNYQLSVNSLYISKDKEYLASTIFSPGYWLYIEFLLSSEFATAVGKADDLHVMKKCHATSFNITGRDSDFVTFDASFLGTDFS